MNTHNLPALPVRIDDILQEYTEKAAQVSAALAALANAHKAIEIGATVGGRYVEPVIRTYCAPHESAIQRNLLQSAWWHVYDRLKIGKIAPLDDRKKFELSMADPPEFTLENVAATFGKYGQNPRFHILKGLAQCFCDLDPAYKSHSKVKIGVKGLPKRIILTNCGSWGSYGYDRLKDTINALRVYQSRPHIDHRELADWMDAANSQSVPEYQQGKRYPSGYWVTFGGDLYRADGGVYNSGLFDPNQWSKYQNPEPELTLKRFGNGNAHLIFSPEMLKTINRALAEFYGDVLPDTPDAPDAKRPGTDVAKDLQFYRTPAAVVDRVVSSLRIEPGALILEPSCGDGAFLDALARHEKRPRCVGIEVDPARASLAADKGHKVLQANFLQCAPDPRFDLVVMNPPFYGRHYLKHIRHALKFLKPGGKLVSILPASAWYDHGELQELNPQRMHREAWTDLPVASFAESGTNVGTGVFTCWA